MAASAEVRTRSCQLRYRSADESMASVPGTRALPRRPRYLSGHPRGPTTPRNTAKHFSHTRPYKQARKPVDHRAAEAHSHCQFQKSSALDPAEVRGECRGLLTSGCQKSRAPSCNFQQSSAPKAELRDCQCFRVRRRDPAVQRGHRDPEAGGNFLWRRSLVEELPS